MTTHARRHVSRTHVLVRQVRYQMVLMRRSPTAPFFTLAVPWMLVATLDVVYGGRPVQGRPSMTFPQFYLPAMMTFAIANACYTNVITGTTVARQSGLLKRIRGTPMPGWVYLGGRMVSAGIVCIISVVGVMAISVAVSDARIVWGTLPGSITTALAGMLCFSAVGLAVTPLISTTEGALPVAYGTILPLAFVSEVFFPSGAGPGWLTRTASYFPLQPLAHALALNFTPGNGGAGFHLRAFVVLAAWTVAASVALVFFRWNPTRYHTHRRRGRTR